MLIVTDEQLRLAGIRSLSKRCPYCRKALNAYPLILSDDAGFAVYHAACAAALAIEIKARPLHLLSPACPEPSIFCSHRTRGQAQ